MLGLCCYAGFLSSCGKFLPGEFHGQRSLAGYSLWGGRSQTRLSAHAHAHPHTHTHTGCSLVALCGFLIVLFSCGTAQALGTHTHTHTHTHTGYSLVALCGFLIVLFSGALLFSCGRAQALGAQSSVVAPHSLSNGGAWT